MYNKFPSIEKAQATIKDLMWDGYSAVTEKPVETPTYTIILDKGSYKIGRFTEFGTELLPERFWTVDKLILNCFKSLEDARGIKEKLISSHLEKIDRVKERYIIVRLLGDEDRFKIYFLSSDGRGYVPMNHDYTFMDTAMFPHKRINYFSTYEDAVTAVNELETR